MATIPALAHYLDLESVTSEQFWGLLRLAKRLKEERLQQGQNQPILAGKSLAMLFMKPSLRTRVSFEMGMQHLGGYAFYLSPQEVGLGTRESAADVVRVLSGYVDGIMARVFDHQHILDFAQWGSVPIINGLSDFSHPCQALADILTLWEAWGDLMGRTLVYIGDGANNVATSLVQATGLVGMQVRIVAPKGYQPDRAILEQTDADVTVTDDIDGVIGADVIYTDVWTSMGQEAERDERLRIFPPYQINQQLLAHSRNADVKVLHCLPAHRGEEITDAVADGDASLLFPQAHNRLHAQKAVLAHLLGAIPLE
ncbi:MAG: ornithine carbamoyltransferase [Caldilineaceae bacterium]|nr:ornithine carbamoyltransferase [Caldilineaceae bacterium]MCB0126425.1 ornithine carbamoyltransferase [Caldilineaceae bacterium]